jgi:DNA polymerase-3 subunit alpha
LHTDFSLLDCLGKIDHYMKRANQFGMGAVALTDHGALYGAINFYDAAHKAGVKPIIGVEAYVAPGSRFDRTPGEREEKYYHLTLLAEDEAGYRNLLKLVSTAYLEGFYHRPRMDKQLLAEHAEGVLCLSGCLSSEIGVQLVAGQRDRALETAATYRDIFGADRYFIEVQDHGLADQRAILRHQVELAHEIGVPVVATNDLHYTRPDDAKPHDVLLCIQ